MLATTLGQQLLFVVVRGPTLDCHVVLHDGSGTVSILMLHESKEWKSPAQVVALGEPHLQASQHPPHHPAFSLATSMEHAYIWPYLLLILADRFKVEQTC